MSENLKKYLIRTSNLLIILLLFFCITTIILFIQEKYLFSSLSFIFIPTISWDYYLFKKIINEHKDDLN